MKSFKYEIDERIAVVISRNNCVDKCSGMLLYFHLRPHQTPGETKNDFRPHRGQIYKNISSLEEFKERVT